MNLRVRLFSFVFLIPCYLSVRVRTWDVITGACKWVSAEQKGWIQFFIHSSILRCRSSRPLPLSCKLPYYHPSNISGSTVNVGSGSLLIIILLLDQPHSALLDRAADTCQFTSSPALLGRYLDSQRFLERDTHVNGLSQNS